MWSWDTAFEATNTADYSVGLLLAEHADGYNVLAIHRSRLEFPQLKRKVQQLWDAWPADVLLIEKKASGAPLAYCDGMLRASHAPSKFWFSSWRPYEGLP